jgi:hypothetical protein
MADQEDPELIEGLDIKVQDGGETVVFRLPDGSALARPVNKKPGEERKRKRAQ